MREPKTVAESCQELSDLLEEISVSTTAFIRTHREARIDLRELPGELTKLKTILELLHGDLKAGIAVVPQPLELELAGLVSDLHHVLLRAQGLLAGAGETTEQQMSELKAVHTLIAAQGSALEITLDLVPLVGKDSNVANKIKGSHNDLLGKISKLRTRPVSSGAVNTADEKSTFVVCHYLDELAAYLSAIKEEINGESSQDTSSFESDLSEADTLHLSSQTRPTLTGNVAANPVYSNSSQDALHPSTQPSVPPPNYSSLTLVEPSQLRARESHRTQTGTAFSRPNLSNWSISAPPAIEYFSLSPDEKLIAYVIPHGVGLTGRTIQIKEVDTGRTVATLPDVPGERLESSTQQPTRADIISERHSLIIVQLPGGRLSLWNYDVTKRGVCGMMDMAAKTNRWKAYTTPGGDEATVVLERAVRAEAYRPELVRYKIVFSPLSVDMTYRAAFSQRTKRLGFGFGSASPDDLVLAYHGASSHQPWSSFKPFLYTQTPRNFDQRRLTLLDEDAPEPLPTDGWTSSLRRSLLNAPCRVVSCTEHGGRLVVVWKSDPVILGVPAGQPRYVLVVREGDRSGAVELVPPGRQAPNCVVVSPDNRLVAVMGCGRVEVCEIVVSGVSSAATGARAPFTVRMRRALVYETIRAVHGVFLASCKGLYTMEQTGHGRGVVAPFAARFTNLDADTGGSTESGGGSLSHQNREVGLA
ncbi:hypothetical protein PoMZ_05881 [Pyricularia oryzae]|uniref:Fungal N-terminal domain-containing protein n=1 Tax=Pyricularia oryzae TaxID=318829 RepID=A0A4P7NPE5_PYROR|nr:hypothetical protein PoMZ_05881 [Pyricularia oryzae]